MFFSLNHDKTNKIVEMQGVFVNHFLLYDDKDTVLIDTGFLYGMQAIKTALRNIGRSWQNITSILLTHGHLDHALHASKLKQLTSAPLACSPLEQLHLNGEYPYSGISQVCGRLEEFGYWWHKYQPAKLDSILSDGDTINMCGGIQAIHLPGHSEGHLGYLHLPSRILFTGDLINTRRRRHRFPPPFLNTCPHFFHSSIHKIHNMELNGLMSNHGPTRSPQEQLLRFRIFAKNYLSNPPSGHRILDAKDAFA